MIKITGNTQELQVMERVIKFFGEYKDCNCKGIPCSICPYDCQAKTVSTIMIEEQEVHHD